MPTAQARGTGTVPKEIRANSLILEDENGKNRAMLDAIKGKPALTLFDEDGKPRARLGATKTVTKDGKTISYPESSLLLFGPDGKTIWSAPR